MFDGSSMDLVRLLRHSQCKVCICKGRFQGIKVFVGSFAGTSTDSRCLRGSFSVTFEESGSFVP